jgi:hypothetical protein
MSPRDGVTADAVDHERAARTLAEAVKAYAAAAEDAGESPSLPRDIELTATEAATAACALLAAADLEVFELGMWQVWGRR